MYSNKALSIINVIHQELAEISKDVSFCTRLRIKEMMIEELRDCFSINCYSGAHDGVN